MIACAYSDASWPMIPIQGGSPKQADTESERKFFQDASAKVPLPEVARLFRKVARAKEESESVGKLQRLGLGKRSANKSSS